MRQFEVMKKKLVLLCQVGKNGLSANPMLTEQVSRQGEEDSRCPSVLLHVRPRKMSEYNRSRP